MKYPSHLIQLFAQKCDKSVPTPNLADVQTVRTTQLTIARFGDNNSRRLAELTRQQLLSMRWLMLAALLLLCGACAQTVNAQTAPSVFSKGTNTGNQSYSYGVAITISGTSEPPGTVYYYTLDGSDPTNPSNPNRVLYSGAFDISTGKEIKATAFATPNYSPVTTAFVEVDPATASVLTGSSNRLYLWLRSDFGVINGTGSSVQQWSDLSGNQFNCTQANSSNQPTVVSNAFGSLPAINFSGSSQFLQIPSFDTAHVIDNIFMVVKPASVTAGARLIEFGTSASETNNNVYLSEPTSTGLSFYVLNGSTTYSVTSSSAITVGQFQVVDAELNISNVGSIYTNSIFGASQSSMTEASGVSRAFNYIGQGSAGGNYFNGQILEIIVYGQPLTADQRAGVQSYLVQKYQALQIPPAAPTFSLAAGTLNGPSQLTITGPAGATLYATTDGSTPTTSSPVVNGPINILYSETVKAIAVSNGVQSSVTSASYTLDSTRWPPPGSGTIAPSINLQLPNATE